MSNTLTPSGLQSSAGLYGSCGVYQFDRNGAIFNPLDLNPYLLFDAESSMIGTLENPTLDLDPTKQESLDVITATRAGIATYTDANGNIATASADTVRVDYTQGAELTPTKFQRVENTDFSQWSHSRTSGTANAAISPDGQNNATYVEQNAGQTNAGSIYRFNSALTGVFTLSVYAKKKEKDFVVLYDSNIGRTYFNLETGTVGTIAAGNTANIEDAGNGWFLCSTTFTASSGAVKAFYVGETDNSTVVTDSGGIYIYGPQLEEGTTASDFVENTTGSPKFTGISATYAPRVPMIMVEMSSENLLPYSEDFSNPDWTKSAILIDSNQTKAPNGSIVADKLMEEGVNQTHLVFKAGITDLGTISVYAKQGDANNRLFQIRRDGGSNSWSWFDLQAGTVEYQTQGVASIEDAGNGWHRCTFTPTNSNGTVVFGLSNGGLTRGESYQGDGTSGVYIWGAQLEAGSLSTSVIPTSGSTVTRAADDLVISGSAFDFYNGSEGTFYMELIDKNILDSTSHLFLHAGGNNLIFYSNGSSSNVANYDGANFLQFSGIPSNQLVRMALSYASSTKKLSVNGNTSSDSPYNGNYSGISSLYLGTNLSGHIKRVLFWPYSSDRL